MSPSPTLDATALAAPPALPQRRGLQRRRTGVLLTVGLAAAAVAMGLLLPRDSVAVLVEEYGPVEATTLWLYGVAVVALLLGGLNLWPLSDRAAGAVLLAAMAAREADLHTEAFGISILKLRFYLDAPVQQVLIALAMLLPIVLAGLWLVWRHGRGWAMAPWRWTAPVVTLAAMGAAMVFAKVMDRTPSTLDDLGLLGIVPPVLLSVMQSLEEILELGLPLYPVLALAQAHALRSPAARM